MGPAIIRSRDEFEDAVADGATVDLGADLWEEIVQDLYAPDAMQARLRIALMQSARIAAASNYMTHRFIDGMGEIKHRTPVEAYHAWAQRFGYENGDDVPDYSCWDDPSFVREWVRDNPEVRVPSGKKTNRVAWTRAVEAAPAPERKPASKVVLTDARGNV